LSLDFTSLTASDIARHYGRRKALSQISFECRAGELVGLLGPNGAGKSTLLAILATLLTPSAGRVTYDIRTAGESAAAIRSRIGLLGHDLFLYPELTARENLLFFARLYDLANADAVVEASLAHAQLTDRADDRVGAFSRGMRQRLALERALVHAPRLLLLDEPFTGLDQASATALVARLKGLQAQGCMVMVATHDLDVAEGLLSRALYLRNGRLVRQDEGGDRLHERYQAAMSAS
jgi:heme ABC exporter ATP-binding subunit CcmA